MQDDILIIGAGHNGLTCAAYLAAAGLKVRILERRHIVGGAAVTEEFHPGFRNSVASYTVSLLQPKIVADLDLAAHGLKLVERRVSNFLPLSNGDHFLLYPDAAATQREVARFSTRDAERLPRYWQKIETAADFVRSTLLQAPPNLDGRLTSLIDAAPLGTRLWRMEIEQKRDLLEMLAASAGDMLDGWFESDPIKAAYGWDSIVGNFASPYASGSAYVLLHHAIGAVTGRPGIWAHAIGGMGAITQAMARAAEARGVQIETNASVQSLITKQGRAAGVVLEDGRRLEARAVISNLNPRLLFTRLVAPDDLPPEFLERISRWRCRSGSFRMNVALSELPDFIARPNRDGTDHLTSGILIAPSLAYMDRAYSDARQHGWSREPVVELLIPSLVDDTLAPAGQHVASLFCQHFAPELPNGDSWDLHREAAADLVIDTVDRYAPNFKSSILARQILSPLDLERIFGLIGGDIFHGALDLDQLFSARPMLGYADYRTPIAGLYQCGSGTHPGGGVSGSPGHNAARRVLRDFRRR